LSESQAEVENNSALRSFTQSSAGAVFSTEDVERLRSEDPKRDFFFVVVGDNQNKYFKVKTRFFRQLFGLESDREYAGLKSTSPVNGVTKKPAPESRSKAIDEGSVTAGNHEWRDEAIPAPSTASVVSTKQNPDTRTTIPTPVSTNPDAVVRTGNSGARRNNATGRLAGEQSNAYRYDSALIAEWWNLREPDVRGSSQSVDSKSLENGHLITAEQGSMGAWSDEKPRIRHDGVRIDRIAVDGPADQAGLRIGDDLLTLDGVYLFTAEDLLNKMHGYKPGTKVPLRYRRRSTIYDSFVIMGPEETQKIPIKAEN